MFSKEFQRGVIIAVITLVIIGMVITLIPGTFLY